MLVNSREILKKAQERHCAIPSPDLFDLHSVRSYMKVAERLHQPIIIAYAPVHGSMMSVEEAAMLGKYYCENSPVPAALHLDHGTDLEQIKKAIALGFTSVMIDASAEPFAVNVAKTAEVVKYAHACNVTVEAEIGHVGTGETYCTDGSDTIYTEPDMAARFAGETEADSLAVSIGTAHGRYKGTPRIGFDRLAELRRNVHVPLVLHGGSGLSDSDFREAIRRGIAKVNIFTDISKAQVTGMQRAIEAGINNAFDMIPFEVDEVQWAVEGKMQLFSSANHAHA